VRGAVVVVVVRDALTDQRFVESVCRCGTCVSVAVLLALQFIMSAATCPRLPHGRSVSSSFAFRVYMCLCVRVCVRARAAAVAAVGLSQSCFHVPLCSTLLLGRCRASTYSSSAPSGFFSATYVQILAPHTSNGERRVGWSQLTLIVIVCWDPRAFCR